MDHGVCDSETVAIADAETAESFVDACGWIGIIGYSCFDCEMLPRNEVGE